MRRPDARPQVQYPDGKTYWARPNQVRPLYPVSVRDIGSRTMCDSLQGRGPTEDECVLCAACVRAVKSARGRVSNDQAVPDGAHTQRRAKRLCPGDRMSRRYVRPSAAGRARGLLRVLGLKPSSCMRVRASQA